MLLESDPLALVQMNGSASSISDERLPSVRKFGILSQTVAAGSQVRWILPARIRSRKHNDIVFVSDSSIQLRECLPDGTLYDATAKLNIGAQIMGAKVISAKLEKIAKEDLVLQQIWDEEQFSIRGRLCTDEQPPQILVLCTDAAELLYVYAVDIAGPKVRFVYAKRDIASGVSMSSKWGRHMAIDSQSKLLAAASANAVAVFSLRDVDHIKDAIDHWNPRQPTSFCPNKEQRFLPVDGVIVRMSFLRSPDDEQEKVFLLVLVAKHGQSKLLLYRWDSREPLIYIGAMKCSGRALPSEDAFPSLLIPGSRPISFWIVTEREMVFYDDIRSTKHKRLPTRLQSGSRDAKMPLWVQWAKPQRHDEYEKDKEDLLLVREDGMTKFISRTYNPLSNAVTAVTPGDLNMCVDSAVCMLSGPRTTGGDILIAAGVDADGAVFWLGPRELPQIRQSIPNISPLSTTLCVSGPQHTTDSSNLRQRTFGVSGMGVKARIHELQFGLEAQGIATIPLTECSTFDRLWAFEQEEERCLYFITSDMDRTVLLTQDTLRPDDLRLIEDENSTAISLNEESLAVAQLRSGVIVQITPSGVRAITSSVLRGPYHVSHALERCVCADIDAKTGVFAVACTDIEGCYISMGMVSGQEMNPNIAMSPEIYRTSRPFSLRLVQVNDTHLLGLGYFDGTSQLLTMHPSDGIRREMTISDTSVTGIGVSSLDILHLEGSSGVMILIGRLDGSLDIGTVDLQQKNEYPFCENYRLQASYSFGLSRVLIKPDAVNNTATKNSFVSGDSRLARLSLISIGSYVDFTLDDIWITDRTNMSASQPQVRAVCRVPQIKSDHNCEWSGTVLFGAGDDIVATNLVEQRQLIPRWIMTCPNAVCISYSDFFHRLVIGSSGSIDQDDSSPERPAVLLLDLVDSARGGITTSPVSFGRPGEMVKTVLNWSPSDGRTHYNLVVVGLYDGYDSRIGHLSANKISNNQDGSATFKTIMTLPHIEVQSVCEFSSSSLAVSAGNQLVLLHLDIDAKKWSQRTRYEIPSPATSISARGVFLYAATIKHSMIVLRLVNEEFRLVFADRTARNARHVVPFGKDGRHVLVSTEHGRGTSVFGYMQGSNVADRPQPSFEAKLPILLRQLMPIASRHTGFEHYAFQGSTIDGTVYHLQTLTFHEYKLLRFLEKAIRPDITKSAKKQMSLLTKKMAHTWVSRRRLEGQEAIQPNTMHINGDIIERLVEGNGNELREALKAGIKAEDDMLIDSDLSRQSTFEALAERVIGSHQDQIGAVTAWARKLLRSTIL